MRHAETPNNVRRVLDTSVPGPALTDSGTKQAATLVDAFHDEDIDAIFASTLVRTQLTAGPLATARTLTTLVRDGIREVDAGDLDLRGDEEAISTYLATAFAWSAGNMKPKMPGGETGSEMLGRFDMVVDEAQQLGVGDAMMISHGAAIRVWVAARASNVTPEFASAHPLQNTGYIRLEARGGVGWEVLEWNTFARPGTNADPEMMGI